jgi:hypothetical protein
MKLTVVLLLLLCAYKLHGRKGEPTGWYRFSTRLGAAVFYVRGSRCQKRHIFMGIPYS